MAIGAPRLPADTLFDHISEAVIALDGLGRIRAWNGAAERLYGWSADEACGREGSPVLGSSGPHGNLAASLAALYQNDGWRGRATHHRKDGSPFQVETAATSLRDDRGNVRGFLMVNRDITAELGAEQRLQQLDRTLEQLATTTAASEPLPESTIIPLMRLACDTLEMPNAALLRARKTCCEVSQVVGPRPGLSVGELPPWLVALHENLAAGDASQTDSPSATASKPLAAPHAHMQIKPRHGAVPQPGPKGTLCLPVGIDGWFFGWLLLFDWQKPAPSVARSTMNMSRVVAQWLAAELRHLSDEARLLHSDKLCALGSLAAGVAHEINNPLAGVKACVQALSSGTIPAERQLLYWQTVADGVQRIEALARSFTDYARKCVEEPRAINLATLVQQCLALLAPAARVRGVRVDNRVVDGAAAFGREKQLMQALVNVVLNAIEASPHGSTVRVEARCQPEWCTVYVLDQGGGFSPEALEQAFDPFFSTKAHANGTGLGLAISAGLVRQNGGTMTAANSRCGGACVSMRVPMAAAPTEAEPPAC